MMIRAMIVDLDGTLVANQHRPLGLYVNPITNTPDYESWTKGCISDPAAEWCVDIVNTMSMVGYHVIFLTRRGDTAEGRKITEAWLKANISPDTDYTLIMCNPEDDGRPDSVVKLEKYYNEIAPYYDVKLVIDDKRSNIDIFRNLGIPSLHCADY